MSNTVLTHEQRVSIEGECHLRYASARESLVKTAIELAEQAVLQSPEVQARRWQPIDTAPKDGTWIAAWRNIEGPLIGDPLVFVCWFDFDDEPGWAWPSKPYNPWTFEGQEQAIQCIEEGYWYSSDEFTHWMPLPAPPSDAAMEKQP